MRDKPALRMAAAVGSAMRKQRDLHGRPDGRRHLMHGVGTQHDEIRAGTLERPAGVGDNGAAESHRHNAAGADFGEIDRARPFAECSPPNRIFNGFIDLAVIGNSGFCSCRRG